MKRLMVVALYKGISEYYCEYLKDIFGNSIIVENYYIENNPGNFDFDGDLIVTSSNILYDHIKQLNKNQVETIVMRRTFTREGLDKLRGINNEKEILFVSNFHEIAVECVSKLYELGIKNLKLIPYNTYSRYEEEFSNIKTAVIAGKTERIPSFIQEIIDIGDRVMDLSTIADIGAMLKLPGVHLYKILEHYKRKLAYTDYGINQMLTDSGDIQQQLQTILKFTNDSIVAVDLAGYISEYNEASERSFSLKKEEVLGRNIREVFPEIHIRDILSGKKSVTNEMVTINHVSYVINKYGIYSSEGILAGVVILGQKYMEMENERNKLRSKLIPKGHITKYNMSDILGNSSAIKTAKKTAVKMARSSSTVLITGESGTGKEVFAQVIHNESDRKDAPFIAVNCSALAPSLLESELFGYEEGAFTGAKKGGKLGLFELADKGTIFLDEIGELPYVLQAKLLRVLMEREIMRIGGVEVIKIDVRVIAATNKNLLQLVEEGQFREDLYYRINVLPLMLPPLRERKEDVAILATAFLAEFGEEKKLAPKILKYLTAYHWPGNVRELHNCIEYMYQLSDERISVLDIPQGIRNFKMKEVPAFHLSETERRVLVAVEKINEKGQPAGRKNVREFLLTNGTRMAEQEVRFIIKTLAEQGLVQVHQGRLGTKITGEGLRVLRKNSVTHFSR
ncbi:MULTISPECIES: sigma-54-dependent Fis family transcriptional regulator [Clostridia]|uniref:sigma-54 interaction domain-containing protein n=1 Tax=Anaerovoracaceae TaxID=543314 RepID=UPI00137ACF24|nr:MULTISPECIES: sigma 54-interacting transcriptional regulator [Clostridia]